MTIVIDIGSILHETHWPLIYVNLVLARTQNTTQKLGSLED